MTVSIQSSLYYVSTGLPVPGAPTLTDISRDDLRTGYQVRCASVYDANTYSWTLAYTPDSSGSNSSDYAGTPSTASLLPPYGSTSKTCRFNVDWDGSYLIRLVIDAGLPTESTMFLRMRSLTTFGELKLTAAGERRDSTGVVPSDASAAGWTADQNQNMLRLLAFTRRTAVSGRVLYVDANRGRDNVADPNDPTNIVRLPGTDSANLDATGIRVAAIGFGDFSSINDAIAYAQAAVARGEPALGLDNPYLILVAPGIYEENLNLAPNVSIIASTSGLPLAVQPSGGGGTLEAPVVRIRAVSGGTHVADLGVAGCYLQGIQLESFLTEGLPALAIQSGVVLLHRCAIAHWDSVNGVGIGIDPTASLFFIGMHTCSVFGETGIDLQAEGHILSMYASISGLSQAIHFSSADNDCGIQCDYSSVEAYNGGASTAIDGFPHSLEFSFCKIRGNVEIAAAPLSVGDSSSFFLHCAIDGDLSVDGNDTAGVVTVGGGASTLTGTKTIITATENWIALIT